MAGCKPSHQYLAVPAMRPRDVWRFMLDLLHQVTVIGRRGAPLGAEASDRAVRCGLSWLSSPSSPEGFPIPLSASMAQRESSACSSMRPLAFPGPLSLRLGNARRPDWLEQTSDGFGEPIRATPGVAGTFKRRGKPNRGRTPRIRLFTLPDCIPGRRLVGESEWRAPIGWPVCGIGPWAPSPAWPPIVRRARPHRLVPPGTALPGAPGRNSHPL